MSKLIANNQPNILVKQHSFQQPIGNDELRYSSLSNKPLFVNVKAPRLQSKFSYGSTIQRQTSINTQLNDIHLNMTSKNFDSDRDSFLPQQGSIRQSSMGRQNSTGTMERQYSTGSYKGLETIQQHPLKNQNKSGQTIDGIKTIEYQDQQENKKKRAETECQLCLIM